MLSSLDLIAGYSTPARDSNITAAPYGEGGKWETGCLWAVRCSRVCKPDQYGILVPDLCLCLCLFVHMHMHMHMHKSKEWA